MAAAELSGTAPSVFERIRGVIEEGTKDVAALLHAVGNTRLTQTMRGSEHVAMRIGWMAERNFYVLSRDEPTKRQLYTLANELAEIALGAAGYTG
jgi:hypothetical protein